MAKLAAYNLTSASDAEVNKAADFLQVLHKKGWNDVDLRKYLIHKRGLTELQATKAFILEQSRMKFNVEESSGNAITPNIKLENVGDSPERGGENNGERPERLLPPENKSDNVLAFLLPHKRADGRRLIKDFLTKE